MPVAFESASSILPNHWKPALCSNNSLWTWQCTKCSDNMTTNYFTEFSCSFSVRFYLMGMKSDWQYINKRRSITATNMIYYKWQQLLLSLSSSTSSNEFYQNNRYHISVLRLLQLFSHNSNESPAKTNSATANKVATVWVTIAKSIGYIVYVLWVNKIISEKEIHSNP